MNVEQCMSNAPKTCTMDDNLARAAGIMWESDCGYVPVVDGARRVVGVITDRDICMAAFTRGAPLHALDVGASMARKVFSCRPEDQLEAAEALMQNYQVRRLPVVDDDDRIVGVLSLNDVARATRALSSSRERDVRYQALVMTLAAISEPRRKEGGASASPPSIRPSRAGAMQPAEERATSNGNADGDGASTEQAPMQAPGSRARGRRP